MSFCQTRKAEKVAEKWKLATTILRLEKTRQKLTLFGLLFSQVLTQEKIIEMVFFLNYR